MTGSAPSRPLRAPHSPITNRAVKFAVMGLWGLLLLSLIRHLKRKLAYFLQIDPQAFEDTSGDAFTLANQTQKEVHCPNTMMMHLPSFINSQVDDLSGTWG